MTIADVARKAGVYPQVANETARGFRNHGRVLDILERYVPLDILYPIAARPIKAQEHETQPVPKLPEPRAADMACVGPRAEVA